MYIFGKGTEINFDEAQKYFTQASEMNPNIKIDNHILSILQRGQKVYENDLKNNNIQDDIDSNSEQYIYSSDNDDEEDGVDHNKINEIEIDNEVENEIEKQKKK
ncbi:hypothetical protein M0812_04970 [Anaeramoeba flamelloides]|uniref:Uncharacterized protein n=1 Tax=Anaeramoeba flamelloides TaxID=1746091 RepID=A0AAV8AHB8_9EUKA|nr:hypothetical protein M0812_04970 [Anaeramoeba flamelloides]